MVYYSSSLGKIRFNRNILYCKFSKILYLHCFLKNLIETFCIVNYFPHPYFLYFSIYLIETFCIVNFQKTEKLLSELAI